MSKPYPVENARHNCAVENGNPQGLKPVAETSDKPANRVSLKEKMETYRAQVADTGKPGIEKARRREEAL